MNVKVFKDMAQVRQHVPARTLATKPDDPESDEPGWLKMYIPEIYKNFAMHKDIFGVVQNIFGGEAALFTQLLASGVTGNDFWKEFAFGFPFAMFNAPLQIASSVFSVHRQMRHAKLNRMLLTQWPYDVVRMENARFVAMEENAAIARAGTGGCKKKGEDCTDSKQCCVGKCDKTKPRVCVWDLD